MATPPPIKIVVKKAANADSLILSILVFPHPGGRVSRQFAWRHSKPNYSESRAGAARL